MHGQPTEKLKYPEKYPEPLKAWKAMYCIANFGCELNCKECRYEH